MTSADLRKKFLDFFASREHAVVPSSSLVPDDPSVLLTTAGMQQFKPYYTGDADPMTTIHPNLGKPLGALSAASIQKSFRTSDIDEVGDERHLTFFEMLGNFSFGGYFKKEAIQYAYDLITGELGLKISYVTVFEGLESIGVPEDTESAEIWKSLDPNIDVRKEGIDDVFWGPTGSSGPCGPTTEMYCENAAGQDIEIWNIVFNEFFFPGSREELLSGNSGKKLEPLKTPGVDTGAGFERLAMITQRTNTIFETDLFTPLLAPLPGDLPEKQERIISDHLRATTFLLADGVRPSNKEAGYVLRRLMRRAMVYEHLHNFSPQVFESVLLKVIEEYSSFYPELAREKSNVINEYFAERERFFKTLIRGMKEFEQMKAQGAIDAIAAFRLYETFGLPFEVIKDIGRESTPFTRAEFDEEFKKHQEISRAGQERKFGGHGLLLDTGELKAADEAELKIVTRLHTATHLLQAALRKVLGPEVTQQGSDITAERTRFDFTFSRKVTLEEVRQVEDLINSAITQDLTMEFKEMAYEEALASGALHFFREKYPARVKVYTAWNPQTGEVFSREFCGGPHVTHTGEIGTFKITKEESSSAGIRRIRAVVEP